MVAWPAKPAATDVVAHATRKECWRPVSAAVGPLEAAKNPVLNLSKNLMNLRLSFQRGPSIWIGMADAARGAATKCGGWRGDRCRLDP